MRKILISTALAGTLAACAQIPQPLCDREAQEWNKFETQEDQCATTATERAPTAPLVIKRGPPSPNPEPPVSGPEDEPEPHTPDEPEVEEPETDEDEDKGNDKPKSDNSDANGKGGNKHDREDKTEHGTETAEDKKEYEDETE